MFSISMSKMHYTQKRGFTVLIAILVAAIVLAIGLSILGVVLKQLKLAGIARESEVAFHAANAGVECARYYDISETGGNTFDVPGDNGRAATQSILTCMGITDGNRKGLNGRPTSGEEQYFRFTWGPTDERRCTIISFWKFYDTSNSEPMVVDTQVIRPGGCPQGVECSVIKSRGYNTSCDERDGDRTVERELTVIY